MNDSVAHLSVRLFTIHSCEGIFMSYSLRSDLSFCRVDEHYIFLDIQNDQYFQLPSKLEQVFRSFINQEPKHGLDLNTLVQKKILTRATNQPTNIRECTIKHPAWSAMEHKHEIKRPHLPVLPEVFLTVYQSQLQLKKQKLKDIIDKLIIIRNRKSTPLYSYSYEEHITRILDAAAQFRQARLFVPFETSCLLDSLSMVKFLARRRLSAKIVFGVATNPFSAHCWVQFGDWVLNDTVGNTMAHTPIRVI